MWIKFVLVLACRNVSCGSKCQVSSILSQSCQVGLQAYAGPLNMLQNLVLIRVICVQNASSQDLAHASWICI